MLEQRSSAVGAFALWTSSDRPGFGDQLLARITERELLGRLPGWRATWYAPLGWDRPIPEDGGHVARPLGERTERRIQAIADDAHASVLAPAFPLGESGELFARRYPGSVAREYFTLGLGSEVERRHCLVTSCVRVAEEVSPDLAATLERQPYRSVRDRLSAERLAAAGVTGEISVVPNPAVLLGDLADPDVLRARADHLRQFEHLSSDGGGTLVLQVTPAHTESLHPLLEAATEVCRKIDVRHLVVLPTDGACVPDDVGHRVAPAELVLEDRLAVLASAEMVIASDEHVAAATAALGVRWVLLDLTADQRAPALEFGSPGQIVNQLDRLADGAQHSHAAADLARARQRVEAHFDALAEILRAQLAERGGDLTVGMVELASENAALRHALARLRERMLVERHTLVDELVRTRGELAEATASLDQARTAADLTGVSTEVALRDEIARLRHESDELERLRRTKLLRWSHPLRAAYGKVRRR